MSMISRTTRRRDFLKLSGATAIAAAVPGAIVPRRMPGNAPAPPAQSRTVTPTPAAGAFGRLLAAVDAARTRLRVPCVAVGLITPDGEWAAGGPEPELAFS